MSPSTSRKERYIYSDRFSRLESVMKRLVNYAEARRILSKVSRADRFWLCTNENLRNLSELAESLRGVNDDVFRYHVNRDKNDFDYENIWD